MTLSVCARVDYVVLTKYKIINLLFQIEGLWSHQPQPGHTCDTDGSGVSQTRSVHVSNIMNSPVYTFQCCEFKY